MPASVTAKRMCFVTEDSIDLVESVSVVKQSADQAPIPLERLKIQVTILMIRRTLAITAIILLWKGGNLMVICFLWVEG